MAALSSSDTDPLTGLPDGHKDHSSLPSDKQTVQEITVQFHQLFTKELQDMLWAEEHLLKLLPALQEASDNNLLKAMISEQLTQTVIHIQQLRSIFYELKQQASVQKCQGMAGLIAEADLLMENSVQNSRVRDAAIIMAMQKINHYEIASYEAMLSLADLWSFTPIKELLLRILKEQKQVDEELAKITGIVLAGQADG